MTVMGIQVSIDNKPRQHTAKKKPTYLGLPIGFHAAEYRERQAAD
jgi:hypothetical protein